MHPKSMQGAAQEEEEEESATASGEVLSRGAGARATVLGSGHKGQALNPVYSAQLGNSCDWREGGHAGEGGGPRRQGKDRDVGKGVAVGKGMEFIAKGGGRPKRLWQVLTIGGRDNGGSEVTRLGAKTSTWGGRDLGRQRDGAEGTRVRDWAIVAKEVTAL